MIAAIVILSIVLIRSIFINFLDKKTIRHQEVLIVSHKLMVRASEKHHTDFVADYYKMYCDHQRSLLQAFFKLADAHSDEDAKAAATDALLDLARLKEIHLDQIIERRDHV